MLLSNTEKRVLLSLHLRGCAGSLGSMNLSQRRKFIQSLIKRGLLDENAYLTKKAIDLIQPKY